MENISSIVLAAGKGTRMKSSHCKVLHEVAGKTMLSYVLDSLKQAGILRICVVVGHQANRVIDSVKDYGVETTLQEPQLGTGHAVGSAAGTFENYTGDILILCGDTPLITSETIKDFVKFHREKKSRLSVMTTRMKNPFGYGRIVRDIDELVMKIVEERDATDIQRQIHEINTGIYLVNSEMLFRLLKNIKAENSQKEYYLTDVVGLARAENEQVHGYILEESFQATGVNTRREHVTTYKYPVEADIIMYTGMGTKGRNVVLVRSADACIFIGGRIGTLNEFTIAYDELDSSCAIGILEGTGGFSDELLGLAAGSRKRCAARLVSDKDPNSLISQVLDHFCR